MDSDLTGRPRQEISSFRKGGTPLAQVMTIRVWGEGERIISLPHLPAKYREKRFLGQCQRARRAADSWHKGLESEKGFSPGGENSSPKARKVVRRFFSGVKGPNLLPE
jgi:hypothetical protein